MGKRFNVSHLLLAGFVVVICVPVAMAAVPMAADGVLDRDPGPEPLEMSPVTPLQPARPSATVAQPRGNPLWSVPLSALTATRERPIFSASRRPPPRAVIAPVVEQVTMPTPKAAMPEPASMQLMGAVVGDADAIAILLDQTTREVIRLRVGENRRGWILSSVQNREATIRRDDQTEILVLQRPDDARAPSAAPANVPVMPSSTDNSYAPFIPRSTPKNGEPDGL